MNHILRISNKTYYDIWHVLEQEVGDILSPREFATYMKIKRIKLDMIGMSIMGPDFSVTFESESDLVEFKLKYL